MTMQEVLLTETFGATYLPIYDKDPGPAYVIDGARFTVPFRTEEARPLEEHVVESTLPHRVHVPMALVIELQRSPDDLVFDLVQRVAELGNWVDYEKSFDNIQAYFASIDLPLSTVVKHPTLGVDVPPTIKVIDHPRMPRERFYCLTAAEHLGRIPVRRQGSEVGFDGTDEHGLIRNPVSVEERGFLIFNPKGILTAFV